MHKYEWDPVTGGILLLPQQEKSSREPRPVYYREMNLLGMDKRWRYPQNDDAPIMWAEAERYIYRGKLIARTKGGGLFQQPEVIYIEAEDGIPKGATLIPVDVDLMISKNVELLDNLMEETAKKIYSTYEKYRSRIDLFYVAFSGGKDSVVALDMVQRTLPHNSFKVVFGDTQMEFPDTYKTISTIEAWCRENAIDFLRAKSPLSPKKAWNVFGPPAAEIRWCCSVFKTTPQILLLREMMQNPSFTGMAFTGIRAEESASRGEYDDISEGKKHKGQFSFHVIFDWNSAELYMHIFRYHLPLGESYYKGIPRAGCLVCPNAVGRSDYFRRTAYKSEIDEYLEIIKRTSTKAASFSEKQMQEFISDGHWRTRSTGRELIIGKDLHKYQEVGKGMHAITIYKSGTYSHWLRWMHTVGDIITSKNGCIEIKFQDKTYVLRWIVGEDGYDEIWLNNCFRSKTDVKFLSLLKSSVIKAVYCVNCGACEAECKHSCIHCTRDELEIGDNCQHCFQCHDIHEHCIRYYSIRNREKEGKPLSAIDRYSSFGFRGSWLESYVNHGGDTEFWTSAADGLAPNKRQDACHQFLLDAGVITGKWKKKKDKATQEKTIDFSPIQNTKFGKKILEQGSTSSMWALIMINLVSNSNVPTFRWFLENCDLFETHDEEDLFNLLVPAFANDEKGHGKQNVIDSLKILFATTPLGLEQIVAQIDFTAKTTTRGDTISLNSITRMPWYSPIPEVILYSLYKFAEACGDYHQFTLSYLMDETIERDGVSPTTIFGLDRDTMIRIINGLAINYPEFISASFSFDLDTITLRKEKKAEDVLDLL